MILSPVFHSGWKMWPASPAVPSGSTFADVQSEITAETTSFPSVGSPGLFSRSQEKMLSRLARSAKEYSNFFINEISFQPSRLILRAIIMLVRININVFVMVKKVNLLKDSNFRTNQRK